MDTKDNLGTLISPDDLKYSPASSTSSSPSSSLATSTSASLSSSPTSMCPPQIHKSPSPSDCCLQQQRINSLTCPEIKQCPSQQQSIPVVNTLPPIPRKPRKVILEKWAPYEKLKRRVIFQAAPPDPVYIKPRNVIVQWQVPNVIIKQQIRHLGEIRANPIKYASKYNNSLTQSKDLPQFILDIAPPNGVVLASECPYNAVHELEGDIDALRLIDLEREGLSEYKAVLNKQSVSPIKPMNSSQTNAVPPPATSKSAVDEIFRLLYNKENGRIKVNRAARVVLKVNSRLGRKYGEDDVKHFIRALDINGDGTLSLNEFREAFTTLVL